MAHRWLRTTEAIISYVPISYSHIHCAVAQKTRHKIKLYSPQQSRACDVNTPAAAFIFLSSDKKQSVQIHHFAHSPCFGNTLIRIIKQSTAKTCEREKHDLQNIKTKQGSAGWRLISWDVNFPRFRFTVGFTCTRSFKWFESAGRERDFDAPARDKTFNKTHLFPIYWRSRTHRTFITSMLETRRRKERDGVFNSLELVLVIEAGRGYNIASLLLFQLETGSY